MVFNRELEASVLMRVYTLSKVQIVLIIIFMILSFLLALIIGLNGPKIIHQEIQNAEDIKDYNGTLEIRFHTPELTTMEQDLWTNLKIIRKDYNQNLGTLFFSKAIWINFIVFSRIGDEKNFSHRKTFEKLTHIECYDGDCNEISLLHFTPLNESIYRINMYIQGLPEEILKLDKIKILFTRYSVEFARFEIWSRMISLIFLVGFTIYFLKTMNNFSLEDWTIEQKWIIILLPLMILFDNPFYAVNFLILSWIPRFIDAFFQVTFLTCLLLFWLCVFHGIRTDNRNFLSFYMPKILVVSPMWFATISFIGFKLKREFNDPMFEIVSNLSLIYAMKTIFSLSAIVYIIVLLLLFIRVLSYVQLLPYFNIRLYVFSSLAMVVIVVCLSSIAIRFGIHEYMMNNNTNHNSSSGYRSSIEISLVYMTLNAYMASLVIIYSPSNNAKTDSFTHDNPSISMVNGQDDQILFSTDSVDNGFKMK